MAQGYLIHCSPENHARMPDVFNYGTDQLTVAKVIAVAAGKLKAVLSDKAVHKIKASEQCVRQIVADNKTEPITMG